MDILQELEEYRINLARLKYWQYETEQRKSAATYGTGRSYDEIKVQTSMHKSFEDKVIELLEAEEERKKLVIYAFDKGHELGKIIDKYSKNASELDMLHKYFLQGASLYEASATKKKIEKAIAYIQEQIENV